MKSNSRAAWLLVGLLCAGACDNAGAASQGALQGVVELDTRTLAFEVAGRVQRVSVVEGDAIDGTVTLAELDESLVRPERDARAAELEAARAQLSLLEAGARSEDIRAVQAEIASIDGQLKILDKKRKRQATLTAQGAMASAVMDELDVQETTLTGRRAVLQQKLRALRAGARQQEIDAAEAKVAAIEASLVAFDARLARFVLRYEGHADVLEVHVKAGEVVAPGAPAFTVADLDHPFVDVFVPQGALSGVKVGMPVAVRVDALDAPLQGRVERIAHQTEFTPRYLFSEKERKNLVVRTRVRLDDPEHVVHAGVPAFATLLTSAEK